MMHAKVYSMTGYVKHNVSDIMLGDLNWEIKTLNNKYCDVSVHLPEYLNFAELDVINQIKQTVKRGSVKVKLTANFNENVYTKTSVNQNILQQLTDFYKQVSSTQPVSTFSADYLHSLVLVKPEIKSEAKVKHFVIDTLTIALKNLQYSRLQEGNNLWNQVLDKVNLLAGLLKTVKQLSKEFLPAYQKQIQEKLLNLNVEKDDSKILQEAFYISEKTDINEELERIESHLNQFILGFEDEVMIGKKCDFFCQELAREVNTMCVKTKVIEIINHGIQMKILVDQIKEQCLNLV